MTDAERDASQLHTPVLLEECLDLLAPALQGVDAVMIDCTLGMGGHTEGALLRFPHLTVIGIDRDPEAIALASARLAPFGERFRAVNTTYDHVREVAEEYGRDGLVDGILMDLGVSSLQLDEEERGFSYSKDAPLDMRMNPNVGISAAVLLATASEKEITRILRLYGEEKCAPRIARAIVQRREETPLTRTSELAELVKNSIPAPARRTGGNPSKRTFQALRIAVNDELTILERAVPAALSSLRVGGRLVVESYQSLEDRIVKSIFKEGSEDKTPPGLPFTPPELEPCLVPLTRGAFRAYGKEIERNPRSAPVRLRGVELKKTWRTR